MAIHHILLLLHKILFSITVLVGIIHHHFISVFRSVFPEHPPLNTAHAFCAENRTEGLQPWDEVAPQDADVGRPGDVNETSELLSLYLSVESKRRQ